MFSLLVLISFSIDVSLFRRSRPATLGLETFAGVAQPTLHPPALHPSLHPQALPTALKPSSPPALPPPLVTDLNWTDK